MGGRRVGRKEKGRRKKRRGKEVNSTSRRIREDIRRDGEITL